MSPEAKAREIAREWYVSFADPKNDIRFFSANMRADFVEKQIVQALRDVERETLEIAAKEAERQAEFRGESDGEIWIANKIAQSIRSLMQKEGGNV